VLSVPSGAEKALMEAAFTDAEALVRAWIDSFEDRFEESGEISDPDSEKKGANSEKKGANSEKNGGKCGVQ
jgi:hypothetical protein